MCVRVSSERKFFALPPIYYMQGEQLVLSHGPALRRFTPSFVPAGLQPHAGGLRAGSRNRVPPSGLGVSRRAEQMCA